MRRLPRQPIARAAALAAAATFIAAASAQTAGEAPLSGVTRDAAFGELTKECYDAGMAVDMPSDGVLDCSAIVEQRSTSGAQLDPAEPDETLVTVRHKLRFTLTERAGGVDVAADAWMETEELGSVFEEPITFEEYLERVQGVLTDVGKRLHASPNAPPAWAGRYDSEQAWHLDAHLRAVAHCDANLADMTGEALGKQLEAIGVRALSADTRDRCEQLYQRLFEWGLERGDHEPTVGAYVEYREALPAEQRACLGRLALEVTCR